VVNQHIYTLFERNRDITGRQSSRSVDDASTAQSAHLVHFPVHQHRDNRLYEVSIEYCIVTDVKEWLGERNPSPLDTIW